MRIVAYRRLLLGQGTAFVGSMLTQVAVPVQVYSISRSSLYVGFVGLAGLVPIVVFGLYGGAIADAMDRRLLYLWSSLGTWLVTLALRIVPAELVPAANTLNFTVGNVGQVIGPLIAGVLVSLHHGFAYAYSIDGLLFLAALYSALRLPAIEPGNGFARPGFRSVLEGLRFIAGRPVLIMSFGVDIVAMVLAMPRSLFPEVAAERFHGSVGLLYAAIPIGSVVAGVASGWIGRVRRQGVALTVAIFGWGGCVAVSGAARQLWLVVVLLAFAGAADLISAVYRQTILQTYAPDEMRGRMQGVFIAVVAWPAWRSFSSPRHWPVPSGATTPSRNSPAAAAGWCPDSVPCMALTGKQFTISAGDHQATVVEVGGGLRRYTHRGVDVLASYGEDELPPKGAGAVLVPWPNRMRGGRYAFLGEPYQLPISEVATGNAIHGLGRWARWVPKAVDAASVTLALDIAPQTGWPFEVRVEISYALHPDHGLGITAVARNHGATRAPFGAGFHPYVALRGTRLDDVALHVPAGQRLVTDEAQLPVGTRAVSGTPFDMRSGRKLAVRRRVHRTVHSGRSWGRGGAYRIRRRPHLVR
jgi:galactose mutarotase-like enzyme/MFS family permease